jgi:hypothetical protein
MIAGLLYLIGLVAVLVSVAIAGFNAPEAIASFTAAVDSGANLLTAGLGIANGFATPFYWIVGGLLLMGFSRVIMLLSAINRSLRGQN